MKQKLTESEGKIDSPPIKTWDVNTLLQQMIEYPEIRAIIEDLNKTTYQLNLTCMYRTLYPREYLAAIQNIFSNHNEVKLEN